jgi:integrase
MWDRQEGRRDPAEVEKWEHYCQLRGGSFSLETVTHPFPAEWFVSDGNKNWVMLLPGESQADRDKWDPSCREHTPAKEPDQLPPLETMGGPLSPGSFNTLRNRLDQAKAVLKDNALATSTHSKYNSAFAIWSEFRELLGKEPYLRGDPRENAEEILDFIAYEGVLRSLKHGSVQGYLTGIRHYHVDAGLGDVTKHPKITATMRGLKKASGASIQKRPVTPQMLMHIQERWRDSGDVLHRFLLGGTIMAFFFMLRASEYCGTSAEVFDSDKIIRRKDIKWKRNGKYITHFWLADEVEIHIRSSKTDQIGAGAFRTMRASGETLCVVKAMQEVFALGLAMEDSAPFMMTPHGLMVTREMVADLLKEAAIELGHPADEFSSHSLRRGGATALYSKGYSREEIMYVGRWKSDVWLRYAKMTQQKLSSAAKDIATASYTLAGSSTSSTPKTTAGARGGDLDRDMIAWFDPDPKDPGTFVLISVEHDPDEDKLLAHYIELAVWDRVKHSLPKSPTARTRELKRQHTVLVSEPREVEDWVAAHPVLLHLGERRHY